MSIYSEDIEKVLKGFNPAHNKLFEYDNYTYHIQFFMVDKDIQQQYAAKRFSNYRNGSLDNSTECAKLANKELEGHKVIIAESGVTNDIFIESLMIDSIPGFGDEKCYCASTEFKLKIKEVAGNGLVNKIHLASKLMQYRCYVGMPLFLSIWFTGYQNTNKEIPTKKIPNVYGDYLDTMTFQVIIEDCKANVGTESTTYDMVLRPITDVGLFADFANVQNINIKDITPGTYITTILQQIEDQKNEELRKLYNGYYEGLYAPRIKYNDDSISRDIDPTVANSDIKAFEIKIIGKIPNYESLNTQLDHRKSEQEILLEQKQNSFKTWEHDYSASDAVANYTASQMKDIAESPWFYALNPIALGLKGFNIFVGSLVGGVTKGIEWIGNKAVDMVVDHQNSKIQEEIDAILNTRVKEAGHWPGVNTPFQPDQANNIPSIITELFRICCPGIDSLPTYNFEPEFVGEYQGKAYYKVTMYITFVQIPGLKYMLNIDSRSNQLEPILFNQDTIEYTQMDYLRQTIWNGSLLKKYRWLLNGVEESVLSYDVNEDNFWYLNVGQTETRFAVEQSANIKKETICKEIAMYDNQTKELKRIINVKMGSNAENKHKDYNINEVANMVDAKTAELFGNSFMIGAEANDVWVQSQSTVTSNGDEKPETNKGNEELMKINRSYQESKIAAENMLSHGQKTTLKLKILGDPYWLSFNSEDVQIASRSLPHLIMDIKTFSKLDGQDNPVEDEMMRFISLYRIYKITSTFQDGQFTQDLEGCIALPFVEGYNPNFVKTVGTISDNETMQTYNIIQDKYGNVRVVGREMDDDHKTMKDLLDSHKDIPQMSDPNKRYTVTNMDGTEYTVDYIRQVEQIFKT